MGRIGDPINVFAVIHPLSATRLIAVIFDNGKSDVRLQRHQLPIRIGKGDDTVAQQKIFISGIEIVLFEFAHFVRLVAVFGIERAEREHGTFFCFQNGFVKHDALLHILTC